jgi:hypothetical protein
LSLFLTPFLIYKALAGSGGEEKEGEVEVVELTKRQKGLVGKSP